MKTCSIIIPSYNQQEFLPDAIESALDQSVLCEIIVVDDGSTDNSLAIARQYETFFSQHMSFKVISQVNKGLASARNTGIMNATGEYILPLDADDILLENCVEELMKYDEDIIAPSFKSFGTENQDFILGSHVTLEHFKQGNYLGYFSAVKRSKLLEIGGYSSRMNHGYEDFHLWINLLSTGATLKVLQDVLVLYRTKETSMITEANKHRSELLAQINKDFPHFYET